MSAPTLPEPGLSKLACEFTIEDSGLPDALSPGARQHPVDELPHEILIFLLGSRYCETDRMSDLAWSLLPAISSPAGRGCRPSSSNTPIAHERIMPGWATNTPASTRPRGNAHEEQRGVCRDYAHLAITAVPLHEHPGALLHRLHGRYRHSGRRCDGISAPGSKSISAANGALDARHSCAAHRLREDGARPRR